MTLATSAQEELNWWTHNMIKWSRQDIIPRTADVKLTTSTDASKTGWGIHSTDFSTAGHFDSWEAQQSSNYRELKTTLFAIQLRKKEWAQKTVVIQTDNTTTMSYINKMGGTRSPLLLSLSKQIWEIALTNRIRLQAEYLPGIQNLEADKRSRQKLDRESWMLNKRVFNFMEHVWGKRQIDLMADRINTQVKTFYSWQPDPMAKATNCFNQKVSAHKRPRLHPSRAIL
jgi:hypothetical protein